MSAHLLCAFSVIFLPLIQATGPVLIPRTPAPQDRGEPHFPYPSTCQLLALPKHIVSGRAQQDCYPPSSGIFILLLTCCVTLSKSLPTLVSAFPFCHSASLGASAHSDVHCSSQLLLHDKLSQNLVAYDTNHLPAYGRAIWVGLSRAVLLGSPGCYLWLLWELDGARESEVASHLALDQCCLLLVGRGVSGPPRGLSSRTAQASPGGWAPGVHVFIQPCLASVMAVALVKASHVTRTRWARTAGGLQYWKAWLTI